MSNIILTEKKAAHCQEMSGMFRRAEIECNASIAFRNDLHAITKPNRLLSVRLSR